MKLKFLFLLLFTGLTTYSFAQYQVKGKVLDENGEALPGVTVSVTNPSLTKGAVTDFDGNFNIEVADRGDYEVQLRFLGFKTYVQTLQIGDRPVYDMGEIKLEKDEIQLQSVEVIGRARTDYNSDYSFSASKVAMKSRELPQAISSVTKEFISDRQAFQLV